MIVDTVKNQITMTVNNTVFDMWLSAHLFLLVLSRMIMKCWSFDVSTALETTS